MVECIYCESLDVIKWGFNYVKDEKIQKYKCLTCKRYFSFPDRFPKHHESAEIVSYSIDLYLKGLSYHVIARQILEQFGLPIDHVTIYYWIQRYTDLMKKYLDTLNPDLSVVWQMDETMIDFKGRDAWCWDCIDTKTRFMIDMYLSPSVDHYQGSKFFERIKKSVKTIPEVITTDSHKAYLTPLKQHFPNAIHLKIKHISIRPNNSFIERFHGTIKNRTKTMRGFNEYKSCQNWLTLFQIYYNFLRPHMALGDKKHPKTPAQDAGINIHLPKRWVSLIKLASFFATKYN